VYAQLGELIYRSLELRLLPTYWYGYHQEIGNALDISALKELKIVVSPIGDSIRLRVNKENPEYLDFHKNSCFVLLCVQKYRFDINLTIFEIFRKKINP